MHRLWILHSSWPTDYFEMLKVGSLILVILQRIPNSFAAPFETEKLETLHIWSKLSSVASNTSWAFSLATSTGGIGLLWVSDIIVRTTLHTHQGTSWLNTEACCWSSAYSSFSLHLCGGLKEPPWRWWWCGCRGRRCRHAAIWGRLRLVLFFFLLPAPLHISLDPTLWCKVWDTLLRGMDGSLLIVVVLLTSFTLMLS